MSADDTSSEAISALARYHERCGRRATAKTILTLLAERDHLQWHLGQAKDACDKALRLVELREVERDAALVSLNATKVALSIASGGEILANKAHAIVVDRCNAVVKQLAKLQSTAGKAVDSRTNYQLSLTARLDQLASAFDDSQAALASHLAEIARLREALATLEKAGSYVQQRGAVVGPHWLGFGSALIVARAALAPRA